MTNTSIDPGHETPSDFGGGGGGSSSDDFDAQQRDRARSLQQQKFNDPRAKITKRGILIGVGVLILGILGAVGSIYARRTQLEKTTEFWGQETITALQLGERMWLLPRGDSEFDPVELTATPGLGHLRRLLLDERNYDWSSSGPGNALENCGQSDSSQADPMQSRCVQIRLTDPTAARFEPVELDIDLADGWIGSSNGSKRVRLSERARPKLSNYFPMIMNVQQKRYDHRD